MNDSILAAIRRECEKIEADPGFGQVLIYIENGHVKMLKPTPTIIIKKPPVVR